MKKLTDFTVAEYYKFRDLVSKDNQETKQILALFDINPNETSASDSIAIMQEISLMTIEPNKLKKVYKINGKEYELMLNLTKMSAAQFIDFQMYSVDNNMHEILSIILLPKVRKKWYLPKKTAKYGDGYDVFELQKDIKEQMLISDAKTIVDFFLTLSVRWLQTIEVYLEKQKKKMEADLESKKQKSGTNGKEQQKM